MSNATYVTNQVLERLGGLAPKTLAAENIVPLDVYVGYKDQEKRQLEENLGRNLCRAIGDSIYEQRAGFFEQVQTARPAEQGGKEVYESFRAHVIAMSPQVFESALLTAYKLGRNDVLNQVEDEDDYDA